MARKLAAALSMLLAAGIATPAVMVMSAQPAMAAYQDYTFPNGCKVQGGNGRNIVTKTSWAQTKERSDCAEIRAAVYYQKERDSKNVWTYGSWTTDTTRVKSEHKSSKYYKSRHYGAKETGKNRQSFELVK